MKQTAYGTPLIIKHGDEIVMKQVESMDEITIQNLVFQHPSCIPVSEIDESYNPMLSVCMELNTPVGPLDIFMITPSGDLVIIETKLWRNPEARRVVVAQILDYAKELSKWTYEDLQREVNRKLGTRGNHLYEIAKASHPDLLLKEADFVDSVSRNLQTGKFLLLIIGDGIREGAAGIAEFLVSAGHLNFTFGMIELAMYQHESVGKLLVPRVMSKTVELQKFTVDLPSGLKLTTAGIQENSNSNANSGSYSPGWEEERRFYYKFWEELIAELSFDDPGQPLPAPGNGQNLYVYPGKSRWAWISAYFAKSQKRVGVYFRCQNDQTGNRIFNSLSQDQESIKNDLGDEVHWAWEITTGPSIRMTCDDVFDEKYRQQLKSFFSTWLNVFVNAIRPRMKEF